jgi:hypothetical protein
MTVANKAILEPNFVKLLQLLAMAVKSRHMDAAAYLATPVIYGRKLLTTPFPECNSIDLEK